MSGLRDWFGRLFGRSEEAPPRAALRCKPGDLCIVKRDVVCQHARGVYVPVKGGTTLQVTRHDGEFWLIAEPINYCHWFNATTALHGTVTGIVDEVLIPLTPRPGTDCETVEDVLEAARGVPAEV